MIEEKWCDKCRKKTISQKIITPNSVHYAREECSNCGKWRKFLTHPQHEGKRRGTSKYDIKQVMKFYEIAIPYCFFCGRIKEQLGDNETLTQDHIKELSDDGKDELNNQQILCTACHKLKLWMRTYILNHMKGGFKA